MNKDSDVPHFINIIWTDYTSFFQTVITVVVWIVYIAWVPKWTDRGPMISPWMAPYVLNFSILITLAGMAIVTSRVILLRRVFRNGVQVQGKILAFSLRRDRGRVEYVYIFNGNEYQSGANVHRTSLTKNLQVGERVTLIVDSSQPKRAYIRHIYF